MLMFHHCTCFGLVHWVPDSVSSHQNDFFDYKFKQLKSVKHCINTNKKWTLEEPTSVVTTACDLAQRTSVTYLVKVKSTACFSQGEKHFNVILSHFKNNLNEESCSISTPVFCIITLKRGLFLNLGSNLLMCHYFITKVVSD